MSFWTSRVPSLSTFPSCAQGAVGVALLFAPEAAPVIARVSAAAVGEIPSGTHSGHEDAGVEDRAELLAGHGSLAAAPSPAFAPHFAYDFHDLARELFMVDVELAHPPLNRFHFRQGHPSSLSSHHSRQDLDLLCIRQDLDPLREISRFNAGHRRVPCPQGYHVPAGGHLGDGPIAAPSARRRYWQGPWAAHLWAGPDGAGSARCFRRPEPAR